MVSNDYLDERFELTADDERVLADMGWSEPAYDDDGDPVPGEENFHLDAPAREADRVAVMAVRALREVFGCPHPAFLAADGLERASDAPRRRSRRRPRRRSSSPTRTTTTTCSRWWTPRSR